MKYGDMILSNAPIGVIMPPPEIKKVIDKAAGLVSRYGTSFEQKLRDEEHNIPKFSFLKENDPYRPYFDSIVNSLVKGLGESLYII